VAATATAAAAAVAAATTTTAAAAVAAAARAALFAGLRLVDLERTTLELLPVGALDGGRGLLVIVHGDEGEPAAAAGFPVAGEEDFVNGSELLEHLLDRRLGSVVRQVSDKQAHGSYHFLRHRPDAAQTRMPRNAGASRARRHSSRNGRPSAG